MAETAKRPAKVAGQRTHIGAFAAFGRQHRMIRVGGFQEFEPVYGYLPRGDLDPAPSRELMDEVCAAGLPT